MKALEHLIPPPLVALVLGIAMWLVARNAAFASTTSDVFRMGSIIVAAIGLLISTAGALTFRRAGTTLNPHAIGKASTLVTHGIFALTRNPMYLGLTIQLTAWAGWLGSPWLLAGPAVCALFLNRFQILPEEVAMRELFGAEYDAYCARVRRWL